MDAFIVRTPDDFATWFFIIAAGFILAFWIMHLVISARLPHADQLLLPLLMVLTGLSLVTLLSLQDPLRDRFLAQSTFFYFLGGMAVVLLFINLDMRRFTTDSPWYRLLLFTQHRKAANGWPWALLAAGLLMLTILFGSGPEGSGVKVNLLGVQPSEVVKYLVITFLAGFFAVNEKFISEYATFGRRLYFFVFALVAVLVTIFLFLLLGDLGPAVVCCFTFIILFSFSRGDFMPMVAAVALYVAANWAMDNVWLATGATIAVATAYMYLRKLRLSESVVMALVVVSGFMLLDKIPLMGKLFPGPVQRLVDRKAIWQNPWDNEVYGGDQVANGIWAMTTGRLTGQGIGEGYAKTIPEAHTDMILPALAEEFGWLGIAAVCLLFFLYLHRSIVVGRQTGRPFLFYLSAGIGIGTFVQFVLIAGGSTGALPLSGVAMPFVSYGGSSLIVNLLAAGFLLSVSAVQGTDVQMRYLTSRHDRNLVPALLAGCLAIGLLGANAAKYLLDDAKWVVEPALVADRSGARMFSYNPRISILINKLQAGDLLDRNGMVLATSNVQRVKAQRDSLVAAGINSDDYEAILHSRASRLYPFGAHTFFWTGDANTGVFNGSANGYFAEYEHAAELRGFPTPATQYFVSASRYRAERFLPETSLEMTVSKRDYSALAYMLLAGLNSSEVADFKQRNRNVQLSIDARLQTRLQQTLAIDDSVQLKRVSVVVMDSYTGDVLASAAWPLPPVEDWDMLTLSDNDINRLPGWHTNRDLGFTYATQPGSTAKLATSLAAFNKLGMRAATLRKQVQPNDLIRTRGLEPDEAGSIDIRRGIVRSNNAFFIRLANEEQLQEHMAGVYLQTGMFLHGVGGYYYHHQPHNPEQEKRWRELWRKTEFNSLKGYNPNNIKRTRGRGISGMSWGQGELIATPASVARMAAAIANNGMLVPNRYVLTVAGQPTRPGAAEQVTKKEFAGLLTQYMREQSANKAQRLGLTVAGKTGTPERIWKGERMNDGWYVFFAPGARGKGHIVTCIRLESTRGSSEAVRLAGQIVIPALQQYGYVKSFEPVGKPAGPARTAAAEADPAPSTPVPGGDAVF